MIEKPAPAAVPIHELLAKRWSGRAYDPDRPVTDEHLKCILEAARWAPSCFNDQPWRYLVWDKQRHAQNWNKAFACLSEGNQAWVKNAPVLLLTVADTQFEQNSKPNRWSQYDTGAASENICLQATALGLMAHQMGGFDAERIKTEFSIPERYICMAMITLGYQSPVETLDRETRDRELAPRKRRDHNRVFFENTWDTPIDFA